MRAARLCFLGTFAVIVQVLVPDLGVAHAMTGVEHQALAGYTYSPDFDGDHADPELFWDSEGDRWVSLSTNVNVFGLWLNVPARVSNDLESWDYVHDALPELGTWAEGNGMVWAPAAVQNAAREWVLFYVANERSSGRQCIGRATASSATGPYVDRSATPFVCQRSLDGSIDPDVVTDQAGGMTLLWKSDENAVGALSRLWAAPLDPMAAGAGPHRELLRFDAHWEHPLVEGPTMAPVDQRYLLLYSANVWQTANYAIGYAWCDTPLGPCEKSTVDAPWLGSGSGLVGPGGPSVARAPTGELVLAFHAWTGGVDYQPGARRALYVEPLDVRDGVPLLGEARRADYHPLAPARLLDTRRPVGVAAAGAVPSEGSVRLDVTGVGGVPAAGVGAVVLNVTVTEPTGDGYVTVWPGDGPRPIASNLNFVAGETIPNLAIAKVAADGTVRLHNGSTGSVHLVADVAGWYPAGSDYEPLAPARVLDTRSAVGVGAVGVAAAGAVPSEGSVHLDVTGVGGVPATGVGAVVLNVTVTEPTGHGYITVWPGDGPRPTASNLNFVAGETIPNLAIAKVAADGTIRLHNGSTGSVHLVADVAGWYPAGSDYEPLAPARVLDTRSAVGVGAIGVAAAGVVPSEGSVHLDVTGVGGVPAAGVGAVVLNVTVTEPTGHGYVTVWPGDRPRPTASNLNFVAGETIPNLVIARVAADGTIRLHNGSTGSVHLVADVAGWYPAG